MANATEFFDNLGKAISKTADIVAKKTDEFISVQKLRGRKGVLEAKLDNTFRRIGETVYEGRENQTEYTEEIERLCREIDEIRRAIEECRKEIALRKGEKICPGCGANVPKEACFCMKCGHTMETGDEEPASPRDKDGRTAEGGMDTGEESSDDSDSRKKAEETETGEERGPEKAADDSGIREDFRENEPDETSEKASAAEKKRQNIAEETKEDEK